jgi:hypothetical protein
VRRDYPDPGRHRIEPGRDRDVGAHRARSNVSRSPATPCSHMS